MPNVQILVYKVYLYKAHPQQIAGCLNGLSPSKVSGVHAQPYVDRLALLTWDFGKS